MRARRAWLEVMYDNADISTYLQPYLLSWNYVDNISGQPDNLQINLEDRDQLWVGPWMPDKGATLKAKIIQENKKQFDTIDELDLGLFVLDEIEIEGLPSIAAIRSMSVPVSSALRGSAKNRAWEETSLSVVAGDLAKEAGLKLFYDTDDNPEYDRVEQTEESDLTFLMRLCNDAGLALKITGTQIVIFDEQKYEQQAPITRIKKGEGYIKKYRGRTTLNNVYKSCRVEYHDANKDLNIKHTFTPPNPPNTERVLVINERVASTKEAERLARKRLRQKNKKAMTFTLDLLGDVRFVAGLTVRLVGFGVFDGNYVITKADHSHGSGYKTVLELRKCLEGY